MKKSVMILILFSGVMFFLDSAENKINTESAPAKVQTVQQKDSVKTAEEPWIMRNIVRGLCNASTCWLEINRCMVYDNGKYPVLGLLIGIPEGACLTVWRALLGVYDVFSFGTCGKGYYTDRFPETVFESKWRYRGN